MLFAAGCDTSISRKMACPSFVKTIPPIGSKSIFNMALGPRQDRIMSATLEKCGRSERRLSSMLLLFPGRGISNSHLGSGDVGQLCLSASLPFTASGVCRQASRQFGTASESLTGASWWGEQPTHNQHRGLHLDLLATKWAVKWEQTCLEVESKGIRVFGAGARRDHVGQALRKGVAVGGRPVYFLRPSFTKSARAG